MNRKQEIQESLTTTMPMLKANIEALNKEAVRDRIKIMAGGAPVTREYAEMSGADGYVRGASHCVTVAKELLDVTTPTELPDIITTVERSDGRDAK